MGEIVRDGRCAGSDEPRWRRGRGEVCEKMNLVENTLWNGSVEDKKEKICRKKRSIKASATPAPPCLPFFASQRR